jgi:hypothetical protein
MPDSGEDRTDCTYGVKTRTIVEGLIKDMNGMDKKLDRMTSQNWVIIGGVFVAIVTAVLRFVLKG